MQDNPPNVSLKEDKSKTTSVSSSPKESLRLFKRIDSPRGYRHLYPDLEGKRSYVLRSLLTETNEEIAELENCNEESFLQREISSLQREISSLLQSDSRNSSKKRARLKFHFHPGLLTMTESIVNYAVSALESVLQVTSNLLPKTNYRDYYKSDILVQELSCKIARDKDNFVRQLVQSFDQELLEDGYFHPSQEIIAQGLISSHDSVSQWLLEIYNDNLKANPSLSASLLKSIGRFDFAEVYPWGFMMASLGILENSVEIRGAAVECLENWSNEQSLEKLKAHVSQEQVPWLRDYISQVIVDISSEQKEMELEISGS